MLRAAVHAVVLGVLSTLLVPVPVAGEPGGSHEGAVTYVHPVEAPVIDPFRAPASRYGPGNRGLEYGTVPGAPVSAAAPGRVVFAGEVAHARHVTVRHADGRLTSYSFLEAVAVRTGDRVERGDTVGVADGPVHVSLREDGEYLDPARFFGREVTSVRLVPENPRGSPLWQQTAREVIELALLTRLEGGGFGLVGDLFDATVGLGGALLDGARQLAPTFFELALALAPLALATLTSPLVAVVTFGILVPILLGEEPPLLHVVTELSPLRAADRVLRRGWEWWQHRSDCTPGDVAPARPPGRRLAVLVAGLDSTSDGAAVADVPVDELGYAPGDVLAFSYEGGRAPGRLDGSTHVVSSDLAGIAVRPYDRTDSSTELARRGELLADLLEQAADAAPGTPIDLFAHSQGGLVVRLALADLSARPGGQEVLESLGLVATMGSPHQGADLATMAMLAADTGEGAVVLGVADRLLDRSLDPDRSTNLQDLAVGSPLIDQLAREPLPEGPDYLSLAGRGDPVVLAERTRVPGADNVVLPVDGLDAHSDLPGHPATERELALALAGLPPGCRSFGGFLLDTVAAEGVHHAIAGIGEGLAKVTSMSVVPELFGEMLVP